MADLRDGNTGSRCDTFGGVASLCAHVPNLLRATSRASRLSLLITTMLPETSRALLLVVIDPVMRALASLRGHGELRM